MKSGYTSRTGNSRPKKACTKAREELLAIKLFALASGLLIGAFSLIALKPSCAKKSDDASDYDRSLSRIEGKMRDSPPFNQFQPGTPPHSGSSRINHDGSLRGRRPHGTNTPLVDEDNFFEGNFKCGIQKIKPYLRSRNIARRHNAKPHSWPWVATLIKTTPSGASVMVCGATIVSPRHVISAWHCVSEDIDRRHIFALLIGKHDVKTLGERYELAKIRIHPWAVNKNSDSYDLILMTTQREILLNDKVQAVCLPPFEKEPPTGMRCWTYGWGLTADGGPLSVRLKQVDLVVITESECRREKRIHLAPLVAKEIAFCAGGKARKDTCHGDSGGPLTCQQDGKWILYGVLSWRRNCAEENTGVYAAVSYSMSWFCCFMKNIPSCEEVTCDLANFQKPE